MQSHLMLLVHSCCSSRPPHSQVRLQNPCDSKPRGRHTQGDTGAGAWQWHSGWHWRLCLCRGQLSNPPNPRATTYQSQSPRAQNRERAQGTRTHQEARGYSDVRACLQDLPGHRLTPSPQNSMAFAASKGLQASTSRHALRTSSTPHSSCLHRRSPLRSVIAHQDEGKRSTDWDSAWARYS